MKLPLNEKEKSLHERALAWVRVQGRRDWVLVGILQEVHATKLYKRLGYSSLIAYATDALGLTEAVGYTYNSVARKAAAVGPLAEAIKTQSLCVWKASRLVSIINEENAHELIEFAKVHRKREIDFEVRRRNPKRETRARVTPISGDRAKLSVGISLELLEDLKRVLSIASQKKGKTVEWEEGLAAMKEAYMDKYDPVRKAQRAMKRKQKTKEHGHAKICPDRVNSDETVDSVESLESVVDTPKAEPTSPPQPKSRPPGRVPLTASQKHAVFSRDGGRCTFHNEHGERCQADRWLAVHHKILVSHGGTNDPSNLTTICTYHHHLVHQMAFAIDGQVTWLRSPLAAYVA